MSHWQSWIRVALLALLVGLLFVLGWWAKREVVSQVRREMQAQLAEDLRQLREVASSHRRIVEAQIQQIQVHAAAEVSRAPVVRANELWRILAAERSAAEGTCGTGTETGTGTAR